MNYNMQGMTKTIPRALRNAEIGEGRNQEKCSDLTSDGQISMYKCHPWICNAEHSRIYNRVESHTYYIECLVREYLLQ